MSAAEKLAPRPIEVGDSARSTQLFSAAEVGMYADLIRDWNPIHINPEYAAKTPFGGCITHGMYVAAMFSSLFATELPGPGSIYLGQELSFKKAVRVGERITATVRVVEIPKPGIYKMRTVCTREDGEVVLEGLATIMKR